MKYIIWRYQCVWLDQIYVALVAAVRHRYYLVVTIMCSSMYCIRNLVILNARVKVYQFSTKNP